MLKTRKKNKFKLTLLVLILLTISVIITYNMVSICLQTVYPRRYADIVEETAAEYGLDEALLYAVIETESGFDKDAVSSIGAMGLMQITPETFEWLQTKTGESYSSEALFEPSVAIKYGAFFLSYLFDEFGETETVLAAYHAGRGQVNQWLDDPRYSSDGKTLSSIPFDDTATYVEKVLKVEKWYCKLYDI